MTRTIRLAAAADADIIDILERSEREFGLVARRRYEKLLAAALHDISEASERPGSAARPELGDDIRSLEYLLAVAREAANSRWWCAPAAASDLLHHH